MDKEYRKLLQKQGYRFVGEHSAVKTCGWTKSSMAGRAPCYKQKFYGIKSHRCIQLSVAVNFCNMDCVFCWRKRSNSPFGNIDDPKQIVDKALKEQQKLLVGFGGDSRTSGKTLREAMRPMHFAISLTGENLTYPKINNLINYIHKRGCSTFVVTNGQMPKVLAKLVPPTQLYVSLSAPSPELFKQIDRPMYVDGWNRLLESMRILRRMKDKTRTVIRLTAINKMNMAYPKEFAEIIKIAAPHYLEVKSYMCLGASKERLLPSNSPSFHKLKEFGKKVGLHCGYEIVDESEPSKVVLLTKMGTPPIRLQFEEPAADY